jgi:hypothetical protein
MKYLAITTTAVTLGVALSMSMPAEARMRGVDGAHGISRGGIGASQMGMHRGFTGSRNFYAARSGGFGAGRLITGRSVSAPSAALGQNDSERLNRAGYGRGFWRSGIWYPAAAVGVGLGYPYYGDDNYDYVFDSGYQTGDDTLAPAAADYSYGNYCSTDVKTCLLYGPAVTGVDCSCRVPGGRAYGSVVE